MTFDRSEALRANARRKTEQSADAALRNLRLLEQAEVQSACLTGDPVWDVFLQYIQAAVSATRTQRDAAIARIVSSTTVNHDEMLLQKLIIVECEARIRAWNAVLALPADLKRNGESARSLIERIESQARERDTAGAAHAD